MANVIWVHAYRRKAELARFLAKLRHLIDGRIWSQQCVVDVLGDLFRYRRPAAAVGNAIGSEIDEAFDERGVNIRARFAEAARLGTGVVSLPAACAHQL